MNLLFVCGRNQKRSPTAERIYRNDPRVAVRSVGVSEQSRRRLTREDLQWADLVLVMEKRYASRIREQFSAAMATELPPMHSLDIPDDFEFMEESLIELIRAGTEEFLPQENGDLPGGRP